MATASIRTRVLDRQAINFEAMVYRAGHGNAAKAFSRALNHEGKKGHTQIKRGIRTASSIKIGDINKAINFHRASTKTLRTINRATGAHLPLRYFGAKQFKYGVRARIWGKSQRFPGAFIIASLGGNVFKNTGGWNAKAKRFNQIEKLFGPAIPKEMLKPDIVAAFNRSADDVSVRAIHELKNILRVN